MTAAHDIINAVLSALHDLLVYMRATPIADWGGYTVTLYTAAISLIVFERVLSVFLVGLMRFSQNGIQSTGGDDDD